MNWNPQRKAELDELEQKRQIEIESEEQEEEGPGRSNLGGR
jgi:hypothetical protein